MAESKAFFHPSLVSGVPLLLPPNLGHQKICVSYPPLLCIIGNPLVFANLLSSFPLYLRDRPSTPAIRYSSPQGWPQIHGMSLFQTPCRGTTPHIPTKARFHHPMIFCLPVMGQRPCPQCGPVVRCPMSILIEGVIRLQSPDFPLPLELRWNFSTCALRPQTTVRHCCHPSTSPFEFLIEEVLFCGCFF